MSYAVLIDSVIPLYALGGPSPQREHCQAMLRAIVDRKVDAFASVELIQEVVFHRMRVTGDRSKAVREGRDLQELVIVLAFDSKVLAAALALIEATGIRGRDAVHAATALVNGVECLVSTDPAFDGIPGLKWVTPAAFTSGGSCKKADG
jgi:predicted nucleic acid-binding protein